MHFSVSNIVPKNIIFLKTLLELTFFSKWLEKHKRKKHQKYWLEKQG